MAARQPSPGQARLCWGYNFLWQSTIFTQARYAPNAVVTVFVGEALIHAFRLTQHEPYLAAAQAVAEFIVHDLPVLHDTADERAIAYVLDPVKAVVLNNQVLTAAFLVKVWKHTGKDHLLKSPSAKSIIRSIGARPMMPGIIPFPRASHRFNTIIIIPAGSSTGCSNIIKKAGTTAI